MMGLTGADLARHVDRLRIDPDVLRQSQSCRLADRDARGVLGINGKTGDFSGIEYPYLDPLTARRVTSRVRLDHPPMRDGKPEGKYRAPYGDRRHLYFAPGAAALLDDTTVPVVLVEAEKAALALTSAAKRTGRPLLVIALGGCWNFRGVIGKTTAPDGARVDEKGPLPDFARVTWPGREAIVLFDARPNDSVRAARHQLARLVRGWGATVRHAHLPDDDPSVNGPDDFTGARGDEALFRVLDAAAPEEFIRDDRKRIVADSLDNIRLALSLLGARPHYDAFAREIRMGGTALDDVALDRLWVQIDDRFHFRPSKDTLHTVIVTEAHQGTRNPVVEYLAGVQWDGTPRLDTWLVAYGGAVDSAYARAVGALPLIAAVRRARHPGTKFDELLILESEQGRFKSSALRALCPDETWFSDDLPLGVDSKLVIERTAGRWIIEAAELHGNRGREAEALKAFLSRQVDGPVRLAYGRLPTTVPRQFILIGTTNSQAAYLKDMTGARRFWPVRVGGFDVAALQRDRDQLWAEAAAREAAGASIRLDPALWAEAGAHQEDRRAGDPWEPLLEPLLEGDGIVAVDCVSVAAIWAVLGLEASYLDNRAADRVAAIVQRHGFAQKRRMRVDGKPTLCWVRSGEGA